MEINNCAIVGHYAASRGNFLMTFRNNLPIPSSRDFLDEPLGD